MSGNYRDESSAAMAANEALRQENDELKGKLADAQRQQQAMHAQHQQQLAMVQQGYPVPVAPQRRTNAVLIAVVIGIAVTCIAGGMVAFLATARPSPPPPVVYAPQPAPTGLRPDGLPYNAPPSVAVPQPVEAPAR